MERFLAHFCALLLMLALPVMVNASSAREALIEEVVVTATKKGNVIESVQDVPIAITAMSGEQLDALKFKDLQDIGVLVPNANLQPITRKGTQFFSIRGLSPSTSVLSIEPTVGIFVNGMYMPTGAGIVFDTFDLESIEVLRGPQGVLQGRNVTGGAVLMNTRKPTDEFEASIGIRGDSRWKGTGEDMTYTAFVSGPLTEGVNGKLAAYYNDDAGWFKNEFNGDDYGGGETTIIRGALSWDATDSINFLIEYEYFDQESDGAVYQATNRSSRNPEGNVWKDGSGPLFRKGSFRVSDEQDGSGPWGLESYADLRVDSVIFTTTIDVAFGNGTITNIYGWREQEQEGLANTDGTPFTTFPAGNANEVEHWSNELRYFGTFGDVDVTTGLYYLEVDMVDDAFQSILLVNPVSFVNPGVFNGTWLNRNTGGFQDSETMGVFTNLDYRVTDTLTISAGLRYTEEEKDTKNYAYNGNRTFNHVDLGPQLNPCGGYVLGDGTCELDNIDDDSWSNLSYRAAVTWRQDENTMFYGSLSRSFRAGNYNLRRTGLDHETSALDEERVDQFELGVKWDPADWFRFNIAFYVMEATDLQRFEFNPNTLAQVGANAADARYTGFELDGRAFLTDSLTFTFALGHIDAKYTEANVDINLDLVIDQNDVNTPMLNAPEFTYNFGLLHDTKIGEFNLASQVIYAHRDNVVNTQDTQDRGSVDTVDANFTLISPSDTWEVSVYGRNLTNKAIRTQSTRLGSIGMSAHLTTLAKGRRMGVEFKYRFK